MPTITLACLLFAASSPWTQHRTFVTTQPYVLAPRTLQFQYAIAPSYHLDGTGVARFANTYGMSVGLVAGLQLAVEAITLQNGLVAALLLDAEALAVRYAPWRYGAFWGNPALELRIARVHANAPVWAGRLVLAEGDAAGWHGAATFVFARQLAGLLLEQRYELTLASAWPLHDAWAVGVELAGHVSDQAGRRFNPNNLSAVLGPTMQWRPWDTFEIIGQLGGGVQVSRDDTIATATWVFNPMVWIAWHSLGQAS